MQTRVSDEIAFILRRRDWQNSSLILDVFTRSHGMVSLLAKGARGSRSKSSFQPFVLLSLGWSGQRELKTLTSIDARTMDVDERNYLALLYVNELLGSFLPRHEADADVFDAYLGLLQQANEALGEAELRNFEHQLMQRLGYFPDISRDAESGAPIDPGMHYQFVINRGFVGCTQGDGDSVTGQVVIGWLEQDYSDAGVRRLAKSVLRSTIDFNLHGKALKSREVYADIMRRK